MVTRRAAIAIITSVAQGFSPARAAVTRRRRHRLAGLKPCATGALLVAATAIAAAQTSGPQTFRSSAHLVEVDVRVTGRDGRFVPGLTRADFEVLEDGVPQSVEEFFIVAAAGAAADPSSAGSDMSSAPATHPTRQAWVFAFDILHLSPGGLTRARDALARFVDDGFANGDVGGVLAGSAMANNRLTSDRAELKAAALAVAPVPELRARYLELREWPAFRSAQEAWQIDRPGSDRDLLEQLRERACREKPEACYRTSPAATAGRRGATLPGDTSIAEEIAQEMEEHVRNEIRQKARRLVTELRRDAQQTLRALGLVVSGLAPLPGRKNVVLFTEGFFFDETADHLGQIVAGAARAGVTFYAVDARGLDRSSQRLFEESSAMELGAAGEARFDENSDGPNSLAVDTGGFVVRNENNVGRGLARIAADARSYYVLAYRPTNTAYDGTFRRIQVKLRNGGLRLRARRGYVATPPAAAPVFTTTTAAPAVLVRTGVAAGSLPGDVVPVLAPEAHGAAPAAAPAGRGAEEAVEPRPSPAERLVQLAPAAGRTGSRRAMEGWAAYERGDLALAARALTDAAAEHGAQPWVHYALGFALLAEGDPPGAASAWERVRSAAPDFRPVYFDLADAYVQRGADGTAVAVLRDAQQRWPADAETHNALGVVQVRRGAVDDAIESFSRAIESAPEDPLGYFNLARTYQLRYLKSRRYNEPMERWLGGERDRDLAIDYFETCIALGGPYVRAARDAVSALSWR